MNDCFRKGNVYKYHLLFIGHFFFKKKKFISLSEIDDHSVTLAYDQIIWKTTILRKIEINRRICYFQLVIMKKIFLRNDNMWEMGTLRRIEQNEKFFEFQDKTKKIDYSLHFIAQKWKGIPWKAHKCLNWKHFHV